MHGTKKHPITEERNGKIYYLMETPVEGRTKQQAEEFGRWLVKEKGFADSYVDETRGFHYVYADPGVTVEQVRNLIERFTLIENGQEIIDRFGWTTFRPKPTEKWFHVDCQHCGYQWETQSQMNLVTCPSCGFKTPRNQPDGTFVVEER